MSPPSSTSHSALLSKMINVRHLSKTYETPGEAIQVLDHLDLTLATGETAAIVGPSGSGKSTLLNLLGALDRPSSGSITIGDQDISSFSEEQAAAFRNHSLGFIFQQQHLLPQLNVLENVLVPRSNSSKMSASPTAFTISHGSSPAAKNSAPPSPAPSSTSPNLSSPTSPPARSTPPPPTPSRTSSSLSTATTESPSSSSPTTSPSPSGWEKPSSSETASFRNTLG